MRNSMLSIAIICTLFFTGIGCAPAEPTPSQSQSASSEVSEQSETDRPEESAASEPAESPSSVSESEADEPPPPSASSEPEPTPPPESSEQDASAPFILWTDDTPPSTATALNRADISTAFVRDMKDFTVSDFSEHKDMVAFTEAVNGLSLAPVEQAPSTEQETGFLLMRSDYKKFQYVLADNALSIDGTFYRLSQDERDTFASLADSPVCATYPYWLIYMNPGRVVSATYLSSNGLFLIEPGAVNFRALVDTMRWLPVKRSSGSTYVPKGDRYKPTHSDICQVQLQFDNDVVYTATFDEDILYLESSDMNIGCRYTMQYYSDVQALRELAETDPDAEFPEADPYNPPLTAKPVIYLYPPETCDVSVALDFQGQLGYTFPAYNGGWKVTAQPDGTLTNKADGSTHYYLFWDGDADFTDWDFSEGFVVAGTDVEDFFRRTLPAMGLVPREYNDFITYWTPELARNPWNLITFSTTEYEQVAPLDVSPAPDTLLRVHMVYKPLSAPIDVKPQTLPHAPARKGFTVVEWGGTRAK